MNETSAPACATSRSWTLFVPLHPILPPAAYRRRYRFDVFSTTAYPLAVRNAMTPWNMVTESVPRGFAMRTFAMFGSFDGWVSFGQRAARRNTTCVPAARSSANRPSGASRIAARCTRLVIGDRIQLQTLCYCVMCRAQSGAAGRPVVASMR